MTPIKTTVIPIFPATNVRSTQGDRWLFKVSDEYLEEYDNKRIVTHGKVGRNLTRKRQLEKYNAYKEEVRYWVEKNQFIIPHGCISICFHIPFPKSWRQKKRDSMAGAPHQSTPDLDNLLKALFDSIMPRRNRVAGDKGADDRKIHSYASWKVWCAPGDERIVISEYNPQEYQSTFFPSK